MKKKVKHNYVDNRKLYTALLHYKTEVQQAKELDKIKPRIPEYVGMCILKIAENLSLKNNFINYPFRDELVGDAVENCIMYLDNFDPERYKNPFAYITTISYYAFLRRIHKEKKNLYIKQKALMNAALLGLLEESQVHDDLGMGDNQIDLDNTYMTNLVEDFEKKLFEKKKKTKKKVDNE